MPNLKSLQISLSLEEDVSFIMATFPELENLNGIEVEHEQLEDSQKKTIEDKPSSRREHLENTDEAEMEIQKFQSTEIKEDS